MVGGVVVDFVARVGASDVVVGAFGLVAFAAAAVAAEIGRAHV